MLKDRGKEAQKLKNIRNLVIKSGLKRKNMEGGGQAQKEFFLL